MRENFAKTVKDEAEREAREEAADAKLATKRRAEEERIARLSAAEQLKVALPSFCILALVLFPDTIWTASGARSQAQSAQDTGEDGQEIVMASFLCFSVLSDRLSKTNDIPFRRFGMHRGSTLIGHRVCV